jgi:hypothetical protein
MFGIHRNFLAKSHSSNESHTPHARKKPRRKQKRRRFGAIEQLERREMMAADTGDLEANPLALRVSNEPQTAAIAAFSNVDLRAAVAQPNDSPFKKVKDLGRMHGLWKINDQVGPNVPKDYYRFTIDDQAKVIVRLDQLSANLDLALYDSEGYSIDYKSQDGTAAERIAKTLDGPRFSQTGVYYVGVFRSDSDDKSARSGYRLRIDVDLAGDTIEKATDIQQLAGQFSYTDSIGSTDKNDYIRFQVDQACQFTLRLDGLTADLDLYLYNAAGRQIASSGRDGAISDVIQLPLGSGTYFARVTASGIASSEYRLTFDIPVKSPKGLNGGFNIQILPTDLNLHEQNSLDAAARWWEQVIVGDLPPVQHRFLMQVVDDLLIEIRPAVIDGLHNKRARTTIDRNDLRPGSGLPYAATIEIDSADLAEMRKNSTEWQLVNIIRHEIGHALGFGILWSEKKPKPLIQGAGTSNPLFTGPKATAEYMKVFGLKKADGVPVELEGGTGKQDSHWLRNKDGKPVFGNELMCSGGDLTKYWPISSITVASMADLGYSVSQVNEYTPPNPKRALAGANVTATAASARPGLKTATTARASLATGLSAQDVDAKFAGRKSPARQFATAINPTPPAALMPNTTTLRVTRSAAIESFSRVQDFDDLTHDRSLKSLRSAFDLAWDDFAVRRFAPKNA